MSLQSERLLNHMLRPRLSYLPNCYEAIAEEAASKDLPYLDFLEQALEAESQAKHTRNVRLKTQWAHFPYNKGLDQFDFTFQPSVDKRKLRELGLARLPRAQGESAAARASRRRQNPPRHRPRHGRNRGRWGVLAARAEGLRRSALAGYSVYFVTVQDLVQQCQRAPEENKLKERMTLDVLSWLISYLRGATL